jgi:WD40 repeat protein/serine/threonine protein kinase
MSANLPSEATILERALTFATVEERNAYLQGACQDKPELRARIESLIFAHQAAGGFLRDKTATQDTTTLAMTPSPETEPGTVIGHYKLLEKIGEGGFGVVYVAEQKEPIKRRVALKIIKLGMDTKQVVARFEAERQALALMDHPNIAKVLDAGATETGRPYFVMEFVRGIPLTQYCDEKVLHTHQRLDLFIKICQAVQHAHQKGIIHRDLKPSNILVTLHDWVPVPKVIDFGIAKATQGELTEKTVYTQFQQFIGTPAYMSPEQAEMSGLDIDTRSDIYSLGVLLYELLTGKTPFDSQELLASGLDEMRRRIREEEPVRPSTRVSSMIGEESTTTAKRRGADMPKLIHLLRGDLDWIVMKCLEKDRTRRYETANAVAMDLQRHLNNEPVVARPPSTGYRLQKSFHRNKVVFTAAGLVSLALVLGVVVSSWEAVRAIAARRSEAEERQKAERNAALANKESARAKASELAARQNLYGADMSLAYRAWEENNTGLALELLNKQHPEEGQRDLRGWEWRYLWRVCQSDELYTLTTFSNGVWGLAISPDGRFLAAARNHYQGGGGVTLWDIVSRKLVATPEPEDGAGSVAFSPDGKVLAYGTAHHGVVLWDVAGQKEIHRFPGKHGWGGRRGLAFSPNGRTLATYSDAAQITLWDLESYTRIATMEGGATAWATLVFLPDDKTLVSGGGSDATVRLWSAADGEQVRCFTNNASEVTRVACSPDGKTLALAGSDSTVRIWDLAEQRQIKVLTNHTSWVSSAAFTPDGKTLISAGADYTIKFWNTATWDEVTTLHGNSEIWSLALSADGKTIFTGAKDGTIKAWDARPSVRKVPVLRRPADAFEFKTFPDSGLSVALHTNNTFTLWERGTLRFMGRYTTPSAETLTNALAFTCSPSGDRVAWVTQDGAVVVWDIPGERQVAKVQWLPDKGFDTGIVGAMSPDGTRLCFVAPNRLTAWTLEPLSEIATLPKSAEAPCRRTLCFANDGESVAVANIDCTLELWNLRRKEHAGPWRAHWERIGGVAFTPDGQGLLSASHDTTIKLWDVKTQNELRRFGRSKNAWELVAVSPDGTRVAGCEDSDPNIRIWDAQSGQELAVLKSPSAAGVDYLAFLPDGNTLLTGNSEEVRLWQAPSWEGIKKAQAKKQKVAEER